MSNIDRDEKIGKAKRRIDVLNKWRLAFLFIAILGLLFVFWGGKLWEGAQWFEDARQSVYNFLWYDVVLLVIITFAKLFATMKYNGIVKHK